MWDEKTIEKFPYLTEIGSGPRDGHMWPAREKYVRSYEADFLGPEVTIFVSIKSANELESITQRFEGCRSEPPSRFLASGDLKRIQSDVLKLACLINYSDSQNVVSHLKNATRDSYDQNRTTRVLLGSQFL